MTIDVTTPDDDDEPFPLTGTGNDTDWLVSVPPRRDLLAYGQARSKWKCSDADLAGSIYSNRVSAFKLESGQLSPFNWFDLRGDDWRTQLLTLMFYPTTDFDPESSRYLDYSSALALLKKHSPEFDAVAMLVQETGAATGGLNWNLLAIKLTGKGFTPDDLPDCLYIRSQVQTLIDRIKVKPERTRKNSAWRDKFNDDQKSISMAILEAYKTMTQEKVADFLGIPLYYVKLETDGKQHHQTGPEKKRSSNSYSDSYSDNF